jgi:hypothetical protein
MNQKVLTTTLGFLSQDVQHILCKRNASRQSLLDVTDAEGRHTIPWLETVHGRVNRPSMLSHLLLESPPFFFVIQRNFGLRILTNDGLRSCGKLLSEGGVDCFLQLVPRHELGFVEPGGKGKK